MDRGTGLSISSLKNAIRGLVEKGFIEVIQEKDEKGRWKVAKYKPKYRECIKNPPTDEPPTDNCYTKQSLINNKQSLNNNTNIGLDKPTRPKRKEIKFPKEDYDRVIKAYQELRGIELKGNEFLPVQQEIKTMFMSGRTVEEIIGCMEWLAEGSEEWMVNWTIRTVRLKLPFYSKSKVGEEIENIPEVAKKWLK